jgi:hypothetical protein
MTPRRWLSVTLVLLLALLGAAAATIPFAGATPAAGDSSTRAAAGGVLHSTKGERVRLRAGHNPTGRTVRGPQRLQTPRAPSAAAAGPITVIYDTTSPGCAPVFPAAAQTAFQAAVDIWNTQIVSPVAIQVRACWFDFGDPTILGGAGPVSIIRDFPSAPRTRTWYPVALANAIARTDLDPTDVDIEADFASTFPSWYFGTDGNTPVGQWDFESAVLHELGHGLGFVGSFDGLNPTTGADQGLGYWGFNDLSGVGNLPLIFDRYALDGAGRDLLGYASGSAALGQALRSNVAWRGANAVISNNNVRLKLYGPSVWQEGSSFSHLDEDTYPVASGNALMTPILDDGESEHAPGPILTGLFQDLGWAPICTPPSGSISTLFHPLPQARAYPAGTTIEVRDDLDMPMLGKAGLPASGVDAVVVNVEVINPTTAGYISVTPGCVTSQTAVQEFNAGVTISNQVTVRLDAAGRIRLRMSNGRASVQVDVAGYYATVDPTGDRFHAIPTTRVVLAGTPVVAGTPVHMTLAGHGIPNDGTVDAATATIEVVSPTTAGYIRVTPDGTDSQTAIQEFKAGQTISNLFTVKLVNGAIQIRISAGSARVQVDINGYYSVPSVTTGDVFHPVPTARVEPAGTTVTAPTDVHLTVAGKAGVPASGATAIAGVVEVSGPTTAGYVRVNPDGVVSQTANQEFVAGQTISDAVAVGLVNGRIQLHMSAGRALLLVDVGGWFGPS